MKRLIAATALLLSSITFAATLQSLNQSQATEELKDKTIKTVPLVTWDGSLVKNTFTAYFDTTGKLLGHLSNKPDNDPIDDTGMWTVKSNGVLCATWEHWNSHKPICVSIFKVNNALLFINAKDHMLETLILDTNIKSGNHLN